jgi:methionyl-tRNA formyltransferase
MSGDPLRVVLFSNAPRQGFALHLDILNSLGHTLAGVVTTPGPVRRRSQSYLDVIQLVPSTVDIIVTAHPKRLATMIAPWRPDLIVCAAFPWIIPADVLAIPRLGVLNGHDSLLPKYRGPNATGWALRNGEREIGWTIHRMTPELDRGNVMAQISIPILDDDDGWALFERRMQHFPELWRTAYQRAAAGDPGDPQDESQATTATMFEPEWRVIDWTRPARAIHNQVRSWIGNRDYPRGAIGSLNGQQVMVLRTRLVTDQFDRQPGDVIQHADGRLLVQCADGPLEVLEWEPVVGTSLVARSRSSATPNHLLVPRQRRHCRPVLCGAKTVVCKTAN